jgi:hypothetical protein
MLIWFALTYSKKYVVKIPLNQVVFLHEFYEFFLFDDF